MMKSEKFEKEQKEAAEKLAKLKGLQAKAEKQAKKEEEQQEEKDNTSMDIDDMPVLISDTVSDDSTKSTKKKCISTKKPTKLPLRRN